MGAKHSSWSATEQEPCRYPEGRAMRSLSRKRWEKGRTSWHGPLPASGTVGWRSQGGAVRRRSQGATSFDRASRRCELGTPLRSCAELRT